MKQKEIQPEIVKCKHLWVHLGSSTHNRKMYKRCEKCGLVEEGTITYII